MQRSIADDENVPATNYRRFLEEDYYSPRGGYIAPSDLTRRRVVNPTTQTEVIWRGLTDERVIPYLIKITPQTARLYVRKLWPQYLADVVNI